MMQMSLRFLVPPGKMSNVRTALLSVAGPTEVDTECVSCRVYRDTADSDALLFLAEWTSEEALERYVRSDAFRSVLTTLEYAEAPPELQIIHAARMGGMELVERIRQ